MHWVKSHPDRITSVAKPDLLVFGHGLIGSAVAAAFARYGPVEVKLWPFSWTDPVARCMQLESLKQAIKVSVEAGCEHAFLWAGGAGGFNSPQSIFDAELAAFDDVVELARFARSSGVQRNTSFHLLSSAGGLFEGVRFVQHSTTPQPSRLYAEAKLEQERRINTLSSDTRLCIYRPSTVYGYSPGGRAGLILTLIKNGLRYAPVRIFGGEDTLRDYIHVTDVARFIASGVLDVNRTGTYLVASGKPSSMSEVIAQVERAIQRKLYLQYDKTPTNALHNSYARTACQLGFTPTSLETGIRMTLEAWAAGELYSGVRFRQA